MLSRVLLYTKLSDKVLSTTEEVEEIGDKFPKSLN